MGNWGSDRHQDPGVLILKSVFFLPPHCIRLSLHFSWMLFQLLPPNPGIQACFSWQRIQAPTLIIMSAHLLGGGYFLAHASTYPHHTPYSHFSPFVISVKLEGLSLPLFLYHITCQLTSVHALELTRARGHRTESKRVRAPLTSYPQLQMRKERGGCLE